MLGSGPASRFNAGRSVCFGEANADDAASGAAAASPVPPKIEIGETLASIVIASHFPTQMYGGASAHSAAVAASVAAAQLPRATTAPAGCRGPNSARAGGSLRSRQGSRFGQRPATSAVSGGSSTLRAGDSRRYGTFEDLLSAKWTHPRELQPSPAQFPDLLPPSSPRVISVASMHNGMTASLSTTGSAEAWRRTPQSPFPMGSKSPFRSEKRGRPTSSQGTEQLPEQGEVLIPANANVEAELKSMLKELDIHESKLGLTGEWVSMLNLAKGTSGLDPKVFEEPELDARKGKPSPLDTVELDVELDLGPTFRAELLDGSGLDGRRHALPFASLLPGVYASLRERGPPRPTEVRGLPLRGRGACLTQAESRSTEARWRKNDTKAWLNAVNEAIYGDRICDGPPPSDAGDKAPRSGPSVAAVDNPVPKQSTKPPKEWANGIPHWGYEGDIFDPQLDRDRKAQLEWKRKVAECAKNLAIEAQRFRFAD